MERDKHNDCLRLHTLRRSFLSHAPAPRERLQIEGPDNLKLMNWISFSLFCLYSLIRVVHLLLYTQRT